MEAGDTSMAGEGPGYGSSASQPVCSREVMSLPPRARWPSRSMTQITPRVTVAESVQNGKL